MAQRESFDTERVKSKRESVECRTFRKCFSVLVDGITDPGRLAVQLYSRELIGPDVRTEAQKPAIAERVKKVNLLSTVEDQIVASPTTKFREFLDVLQNEPSLQQLAERLESTYRELSEQCTASVPSPTSSPPLALSTTQPTPSSVPTAPGSCPCPPPQPWPFSVSPLSLYASYPHSMGCPLPPAKRPRKSNDLQPQDFLGHTFDSFHQISLGQSHVPFAQPITPYDSGRPSSAVDTYASYLKSVYTRKKLPIYDKWPQVKSKKYINLALIEKEDITKREADQFTRATIHGNIDDIKKSKRAIDVGQIAQLPDGSQPKCILAEGAPGVGKSTFAWKLCHKWGKGKLLQQYQLVVLLRLRDKSVRAAKKIPDLFQYHRHHIQQAAVEEIQDAGGKGVLLLFEGYDELPEELRTENSVFLDVIMGRELPEATILITSRPWASGFLHRECKEHISQHIEILGFTKDNIHSYLESTMANDPPLLAGLEKYMSCYPYIVSMMYIPLNCAIVVEVYRNSRNDNTIVPKTMTELYFSLVCSLLLRHLLDHPVHGKKRRWRLRSFSDLPQDVYQQLCELGRIAYKGIFRWEQVIFSDLPEDFETLGLMQCVPELYVDEGTAVSYNFLHLTVQEYLAAFHLSQQPVWIQIEHYERYKFITVGESKQEAWCHVHMVLQFLSGITKFKEYPSEMVDMCIEVEKPFEFDYESYSEPDDDSTNVVEYSDDNSGSVVESDSDDNSGSVVESDSDDNSGSVVESDSDDDSASVLEVNFITLHRLFEVQNKDIISKLLWSSNVQLSSESRSNYVVTPFDCFVLGYCMSHSNCIWMIDFWMPDCKDGRIGDEEVEMLVRGAVEEETHCTGGISRIDLRESSITSEGVKHLSTFPSQMINKLEELCLSDNNLDSESCPALAQLISLAPHLKRLDLSNNPNIGQSVGVSLIKAHDSLEMLYLNKTGIGVEGCQALSKLLSSSKSLKELNISGNNLPLKAVELIVSGLRHDTTLENLNMSNSQFAHQHTISLASVLKTNHTLVILNLGDCNIDSDGACQLASALCTNDTLQTLTLSSNPTGVKGATAFAEMLKTNHTLINLNLHKCNIDSDGACQLANSLHTNDTLKELYLPYNPIGFNGASSFAEMLTKNRSLKLLDLHSDTIGGKSGTEILIDSLRQNTTLERLVLPILHLMDIKNSETIVDSRVIFNPHDLFTRFMYCIDKLLGNEST